MKMELGGCYYKEIRDERSESSVSRVISSEPNASRRFPVAAFRWETTSLLLDSLDARVKQRLGSIILEKTCLAMFLLGKPPSYDSLNA